MHATTMAAHATSNWNNEALFLIWTPSASIDPPKYSPTIAPIIASTLATLSAVKMYGSAFGKRTRRKISNSPAAYERISSIDDGRTEVSPRIVFTSTGKKQSTAAIAIFDDLLRGENQAFVIGAKAMIGTAFAAIAYGITALRSGAQRASAVPTRIASPQPIAKPPSASWKVNQPALQSACRSSQKVEAISVGFGSRKRCTWKALTRPCQATSPRTSTAAAGAQSVTRRPTVRASAPRAGVGCTPTALTPRAPRRARAPAARRPSPCAGPR